MADKPAGKTLISTVRCDDCGARCSDFPWFPGTPCPRCGSENFVPVPVIKKGSDYATADRSQGFALEDVRFGRLAQWAEFITPRHCRRALHQQREIARSKRSVPDLGTLLIKEKLMNRKQVDAVLAARCATPGNQEDQDFARAALQHRYVTEAQLEECRELQEESAREGCDPAPLPLLLYEKRYMQEKMILALLKTEALRDRGLLCQIRASAEGEASEFDLSRLVQSWHSLIRRPKVVLAVVLLGVMLVFWAFRFSGGPVYATVECANCHALTGRPVDSKWPVKCPQCGQQAMYPQAICLECGKRFPVKDTDYGSGCPECNSRRFMMITSENEDELDDIVLGTESAE